MVTKVAVTFVDISGSSVLWKNYPKETFGALQEFDKRVQSLLGSNAILLKHLGDAVMLSHKTLEEALVFAIEFLKTMKEKPITIGRNVMKFNIGVAFGRVKIKTMVIQGCPLLDLFGATVNKAARMEGMVSPVGGFAFTIENVKKLPNNINRLLENFSVKQINFKDKCGSSDSKLLSSECHLASSLKGVGQLVAWKVTL